MNKFTFSLIASSVFLFQSAFAQSIGVSFVSNGNATGVDNAETDSLLPTEMAGVPAYAQTNWNNLGRYGSINPLVLTNSAGTTNLFNIQWDAGFADTTGTGTGLGTPDGKLMNGFLYSWGPGAATALGNSAFNSAINNKPLIYLSGLNSWYNSEGAEGYGVVIYTTGYTYYETTECWIQSVIGTPFANTMAEGADLTTHIFAQDTGVFLGTYIRATGTSAAAPTSGANYIFFTGLTNDAILLRLQCPLSQTYGSGLNGFQLVPIFPSAPTASAPTFSPSATVFAGVPVTITEAAEGDPFHPALFYQWQKDNSDGIATNNILNATNATYSVTPTNSASPYIINYQVIVSNSFGVSTSSVVTLSVNPAVAPFVTQDTTPGPGNNAAGVFAYVGGTVSFTAAFGGTPSTYLWQSNSINLPGTTTTTLILPNVQLSSAASYRLTATNSVDGATSTPSVLTVLADLSAPTSATPYPYDVYTNGPAAYWRLNETADNVGNSIQAYDYSGHNFDATYGNGVSDNQAGPQSPAYAGFEAGNTAAVLGNGVINSFLIAPSLNLNANTVTITAWINPANTVAAFSGLFVWANGADKAGFGFGGTVNGSGMAELGYVWNTNSPTTINFHSGLYPLPNQWSFVALTITPTSSTIYLYYIDGGTGITNLLKSVQTINNRSEPFSGGTTWIGSDTSAARNFNGSLDEVAVFGKSLSEAQVQDLFLKGIGAVGVAPTLSTATASPALPVYSGQNVQLTVSNISGTVPLTLQWQAGADGINWTNLNGASSASLLANPLVTGNVFYHLVAANAVGSSTSAPVQVTFNPLPATPPGLWTANFQITNNVLNFATGGGVGHYVGRGILGTGMFWNVLPDTAGSFGFLSRIDSVSDLTDDGATHSGIYATMLNISGFSSATTTLPPSDLGNLLYQYVNLGSTVSVNGLQFHGVPDGTYNLAVYGTDGSFADRGITLVIHDSLNGDQTQSTLNSAPAVPLAQGVNFVLFTHVHVAGGTLNVDVGPNPSQTGGAPLEADINAAQLQLVSYDVATPVVTLTDTANGGNLSLNFSQGILQTSTNLLGPWTQIVGPSPVSVPMTNSAQFFRVKVR